MSEKQKIKLKIVGWNIQGAANYGWYLDGENSENSEKPVLKKEIVKKILDQEAHIIVLTEFVVLKGIDNLFEQLINNNYIWFFKHESGSNGIFIAIKKDIVNIGLLKERKYYNELLFSAGKSCDMLVVKVPLIDNTTLGIMGVRMKTGGIKPLKLQYDRSRDCLDNEIRPMIKKTISERYVVVGDFNNARCHKNLNLDWGKKEDREILEKFYENLAQINYNLNIIKYIFEKEDGFILLDKKENGEPIYTLHNQFAEDHIFFRGTYKNIVCSAKTAQGLSDHDMIVAEVTL